MAGRCPETGRILPQGLVWGGWMQHRSSGAAVPGRGRLSEFWSAPFALYRSKYLKGQSQANLGHTPQCRGETVSLSPCQALTRPALLSHEACTTYCRVKKSSWILELLGPCCTDDLVIGTHGGTVSLRTRSGVRRRAGFLSVPS